MTVSFSKSISVMHASIRENERRARQSGDRQAAAYWAGREQQFQEVLHRANRATLDYLQAWAGITRTGYHGTRIDGREPGRFEPAGLIVTSWLQGTSRDGDPQDHIHNQIARITRTYRDGKWRALDTMSVRAVLGALRHRRRPDGGKGSPSCWGSVGWQPGLSSSHCRCQLAHHWRLMRTWSARRRPHGAAGWSNLPACQPGGGQCQQQGTRGGRGGQGRKVVAQVYVSE